MHTCGAHTHTQHKHTLMYAHTHTHILSNALIKEYLPKIPHVIAAVGACCEKHRVLGAGLATHFVRKQSQQRLAAARLEGLAGLEPES